MGINAPKDVTTTIVELRGKGQLNCTTQIQTSGLQSAFPGIRQLSLASDLDEEGGSVPSSPASLDHGQSSASLGTEDKVLQLCYV